MLISVNQLLAQNNFPDFRHACGDGLGQNVTLTWSPLTNNCNNFQELIIYGRTDVGQPLQVVDRITNISTTQYTHFGAKNISNNWLYTLVYKNTCSGDSAYSRTLGIDIQQPSETNIDSVSVDITTGRVIVGWSPNPTPDLKDYRIWTSQGTNSTPITRIDSTLFIHNGSTPNTGTQGYKVTALDSCDNQSTINELHSTIFLQSSYDSCLNSISINWTPYVGWNNILNYTIYSRNGTSGPYSLIATNTPSERDLDFSNFTHGDTLEFYIQAKEGNNGYSTTSNKITVLTRARKFSKRNYIAFATVFDSTAIQLNILQDSTSDVTKYNIYRRQGNETFRRVGQLPYNGKTTSDNYIDNSIQAFNRSYQYRVISIDTCGNDLDTSNIAQSIHLSLANGIGGNFLKWNKYSQWDGGVEGYKIFRGFNSGSGFTWNSIGTTFGPDSSYDDLSLPSDIGFSGICYYVEAQEGTGNQFTIRENSRSNVVCVVEDALVYFPNAFAPGKVNSLFLPKGTYIDYNRTTMKIFARNGQLMKEINDIRQGWDGTNLKGELCDGGVYLYVCELFGLNEKKYNYRGTLHLLK